ncbi:hypothetical protein I4U23_006281 [Adineta vaga]|nr:hypothetical protein I4U23_006281 [Adineta vaga]
MFEYLPNEIILHIFSFLDLTDLYRAFSSLNSRLECLLYDQLTPLFARLTPKTDIPLEKFLFRLTNLSLIEWIPKDVISFLQYSKFPQLTSLDIISTNNLYFGQPINELIHKILHLPKLRRCQIDLSPTLYILQHHLSISSSIEHLKLSMITLDMLLNLLVHVPKLRSLNVWLNSNGRIFDRNTYNQSSCCLNLRKLILGLHNDIRFEEVLFLLPRMPILHTLKLSGSVWDQGFLNDNDWKHILFGENSFPLLNRISINISVRCTTDVPNLNILSTQFNKKHFHETNFFVTFDRKFWFYIKCLWNS